MVNKEPSAMRNHVTEHHTGTKFSFVLDIVDAYTAWDKDLTAPIMVGRARHAKILQRN